MRCGELQGERVNKRGCGAVRLRKEEVYLVLPMC